jgi:glycosyltransferase involved in cell wall biosynthesis
MATASLITTFNRPAALARSLRQIVALGAPVLVVDDGSSQRRENEQVCGPYHANYLFLPGNRGLSAALNIGLAYWMADKSINWISYFQDDVDVHPKTLIEMEQFQNHGLGQHILTGHDAGEHSAYHEQNYLGRLIKFKWSIRATHIHASAEFWKSVFPIPTRELGAPKRNGPGRGLGSNCDWWIVRDSPNSCQKTKRPILCVPGLVRSFLWKAEDSCWNNTQKAGEDLPLRTDL